ncbi:glycosyltransferase [Mucilaginibacter sp. PAMB04274]|uniref:glycosyltransferase family 2 protein n=1 Tax=Mucilaginibacter sp. PAMB04274 TaxID=3138568 RepID=UPI0031F6A8A8
MPTLSVIVPVYNKEQYIAACIQSILDQTFTDFELILVNDGSKDDSAAICQRFAETDKRVKLINKPNGGVSTARNRGLSEALGEYIGFIDSDDTIDPDMYELLLRNIKTYNADVSVCRLRTIFPNKVVAPQETPGIEKYDREHALSLFLKGELDMSANTKVYKAALAKSVEFAGRMYEDILYLSQIFLKAQNTVLENAIKYNYLVRDNSVSVGQFSPRYFETTAVSASIVNRVQEQAVNCLPEAQAFDVMANISLLNLLLLSGKDAYPEQYNRVTHTLKHYSYFINKDGHVRRKHKYAYRMFTASPWLYTQIMYLYSVLTGAEITKRTQKQPSTIDAATGAQ